MRVEWNEYITDKRRSYNVHKTADAPAVLLQPTRDIQAKVWRVPVQADPGTAQVDIQVNDVVVTVTLAPDGTGEVVLDDAPEMVYEVTVVGAPELLPSVPVPQCRRVIRY